MVKVIFDFLDSLIFYEMDRIEHKRYRKKPKLIPFYRYTDSGNTTVVFNFDLEDFMLNKFMKLKQTLDGYGSAIYEYDGKEITLLNTYGEEDNSIPRFSKSRFVPIITICAIYDNVIEVADVAASKTMLPRKRMKIFNHMVGEFPQELQKVKLGGKRAFYFYPDQKKVSLRIPSSVYQYLPDNLKHLEAESWTSSPRALINVYPMGGPVNK